MNTQKLDRKRSYGTVYGDPSIGFFQDEVPYKHDGTVHQSAAASTPSAPPAPATPVVPTAEMFPTAQTLPEAPQMLRALEELSSQIRDLKAEPPKPESPKAPDPARSEAARRIWIERRAREAAAAAETSVVSTEA